MHQRESRKEAGTEIPVRETPDNGFYALQGSGTTLRYHLATHHGSEWVAACILQGIMIDVDDQRVMSVVERERERQGILKDTDPIPNFSREAFLDLLVEWLCADDQSFNAIENPLLRRLILMLRSELRDKDIPHRQALRDRAMKMWDALIEKLRKEMMVRFFFYFFDIQLILFSGL